MHTPTTQMRTARELEPPALDEGLASIERVPFARRRPQRGVPGVLVAAAAALARAGRTWPASCDRAAPHLVFDWNPDGERMQLEAAVARVSGRCRPRRALRSARTPGGAPICWCRPPLPALPLIFAREAGVDLSRSVLIGTEPAHRTLATALGARYLQV